MAGLALLARAAGHRVTGSDRAVYPPMSTQLEEAGLTLMSGYEPAHLVPEPDQVVVGNVMQRGMPVIEHLLDTGMSYASGPQWLAENVLRDRWVLAVAGTHGKTTCSAMLAWILEYAGLEPGFLVGGLPANFGVSARLGQGRHFVIEADEYDTAFFDKRSKFVHYHPRTVILNNLEYDHADIFDDIDAIRRQFHHLVRIVPGNGLIVFNGDDPELGRVLEMGCWTPTEAFGQSGWTAREHVDGGAEFQVWQESALQGTLRWSQFGHHNAMNALAVIAAARHVGVPASTSVDALKKFQGVKRRLELRGTKNGVTLYDDFAHHPTAVAATLKALRARMNDGKLLAIVELRSNTMRAGVHHEALLEALSLAEQAFVYRADADRGTRTAAEQSHRTVSLHHEVQGIVDAVAASANSGDTVLVMSNGGFEGIQERILEALSQRE